MTWAIGWNTLQRLALAKNMNQIAPSKYTGDIIVCQIRVRNKETIHWKIIREKMSTKKLFKLNKVWRDMWTRKQVTNGECVVWLEMGGQGWETLRCVRGWTGQWCALNKTQYDLCVWIKENSTYLLSKFILGIFTAKNESVQSFCLQWDFIL